MQNLIKKNKLFLSAYNEEQLKVKFIVPVLNKVDFFFNNIKDWYEYWLSATVNNVLFRGKTDFMIAKGIKTPVKPYFFIQEFKQSKSTADPEDQLLAAMLAAIELNNVNTLSGCYIIGKTWNFVILEKLETILKNKKKKARYEYFVHEGLNCLKINDQSKNENRKFIYQYTKVA